MARMFTRWLVLTVTFSFAMGAFSGAEAQLATWFISGSINSGSPLHPSASSPNVTAYNLVKGSNLFSYQGSEVFAADGWPREGAIDLGKYFYFTIDAAPGYRIDFDRIEFTFYGYLAYACTWQLRTNLDAYASPVAGGHVGIGAPHVSADISSISTTGRVIFRFYAYGVNANSAYTRVVGFLGSDAGGHDFKVYGDTVPLATPARSSSWGRIKLLYR